MARWPTIKTNVECGHLDRPHQARGRCQQCYLSWYHKARKQGVAMRPPKPKPSCGHPEREHVGHGMCASCRSKAYNKVPSNRIRKSETSWESGIRVKYGLTAIDYNNMLTAQGGACAICRSTDTQRKRSGRLVVDHCHKTGKIRALLCDKCNVGMGRFNDDPVLLEEAAKFLRKHSEPQAMTAYTGI